MVLITISKRRAGYPRRPSLHGREGRRWRGSDVFLFVSFRSLWRGGAGVAARRPARRTMSGGDAPCGTRLLIKILMRSDSVLEV